MRLARYLTVEACGLGLFWSWCYCLWFVPDVYSGIGSALPGRDFAWVAVLASAAVVQFLVPLVFKRRPLSSFPWLYVLAPAVMFVGTVGIELCEQIRSEMLYAVSSVLAGASSAFLWHLWGERFSATRNADTGAMAFAFGAVLSVTLLIVFFLPVPASNALIALIPLASAVLLQKSVRARPVLEPASLLPKASRKMGLGPMAKVSCIVFLVCAVCTYCWASAPVLDQPWGSELLCGGIVVGALFMIAAALPSLLFETALPSGRLLLWSGMLAVVSVALHASGDVSLVPLSFVLSLATSVILDVLLASYFVMLVVKGYTASATAFGFSEGFICAAMLLGNGASRIVMAAGGEAFPLPIALALLILLLGDQQREINVITSAAPEASDAERNCKAIADEFGLSAREYEILVLIGQGYTTQSLARALVLSPYTVQTHIKHIYAKTGIHRRSELMDYVNLGRTSFDE